MRPAVRRLVLILGLLALAAASSTALADGRFRLILGPRVAATPGPGGDGLDFSNPDNSQYIGQVV